MNLEQERKLSQIIAQCWSDEGFKRKLLENPAAVLRAEGVAWPDGVAVQALEDTERIFHLVIPRKPAEMSDDDLDKVGGGFGACACVKCQPGGGGGGGGGGGKTKIGGVAGEWIDDGPR